MRNDVPKGEEKIVRHPRSAIWRRARLRPRRRSGQRRKEVMLSDLSVSARHQRRLRAKLQVCFRRCVKSVLGPHHSGEITRTKVKRQRRSEERLTYDLFRSKWLLTTNRRARLRPFHNTRALGANVLTLPQRSKVESSAGANAQRFFLLLWWIRIVVVLARLTQHTT